MSNQRQFTAPKAQDRPLPRLSDLLHHPEASEWLRTAARGAMTCDPVQVANECEVLSLVLAHRADVEADTCSRQH